MKRRTFAAVAGAVLGAGCSTPLLSRSKGTQSLGETVGYGDVDVTVADAMRTEWITLVGTTVDDSEAVAPAGGSVHALFLVRAHNTAGSVREGPTLNPSNYDVLEEGDDVVTTTGVNDIMVVGSGDAGYFPSVGTELGMAVDNGDYELRAGGRDLETYPAAKTRPSIAPDATISGWVVGTIEETETPAVTITYNNTSATWTTDPGAVPRVTPAENETTDPGGFQPP